MRLKIQDWKSAWFDAKINDRFFQEMSRVEKGMVKELNTSAHWMEQLMIEVGQLAQAMIRLEKEETPEPQIRQSMEKSLRLAALSLQLVVTLDGLDREILESRQRHFAGPSLGQGKPLEPLEIVGREIRPLAPAPQPVSPPPVREPPPPTAALPPFLLRQMSPQADTGDNGGPEAAGPEAAGPEAAGPKAAGPKSAEAAGEGSGQAQPDGATEQMAEQMTEPFAVTESNDNGGGTFSAISPLLDFSSDRSEVATSRMHDTIVSLSKQGLSRAEIEAVTGEPRHIIEALINHARGR